MNPFVMLWSKKRILRRGRLTTCMILIALVMTPVVAALIFTRSMIGAMSQKFITVSDGHIQVVGAHFTELPEQMTLFYDQTVSGYALLYSADQTASLQIKGVEKDYFNSYRLEQISLTQYSSDKYSNLNGITISSTTSKSLGVNLGDRVALMVVPDTDTGVLRPVMLQVRGIYSTGYDKIDSSLAFVDYSYAQSLYSDNNSSVIEIVVKPSFQNSLDKVKRSIKTDGYITDWQIRNASVYDNYLTSMQAITFVLMIIVLVAAFYTASVANQMVEDDFAEIAVAKLTGCSDKDVRRSAFLSIFTVTVAGMLIGLVLGIIIGTNLSPLLVNLSERGLLTLDYYLVDFKATVPWNYMIPVMCFMASVSALVVLISLRHTKKITPMRLFTGL